MKDGFPLGVVQEVGPLNEQFSQMVFGGVSSPKLADIVLVVFKAVLTNVDLVQRAVKLTNDFLVAVH